VDVGCGVADVVGVGVVGVVVIGVGIASGGGLTSIISISNLTLPCRKTGKGSGHRKNLSVKPVMQKRKRKRDRWKRQKQ
jgi:hypothetical protein